MPDSAHGSVDDHDLYAQAVELRTPHGILIAHTRIEASATGRPRCLLLHGNPGSLTHFGRLSAVLAQHADVATIDLPGFGRSPRPSGAGSRLGLPALADAVIEAADALGFADPVILIGHSHGGGVAQVAAARHPSRVAAIAPIASLGAPAHRGYRLLALPGASAVARLAARALRVPALRPPLQRLATVTARNLFKLEAMSMPQLELEFHNVVARSELLPHMVEAAQGNPCALLLESAPAITCPALFIHGDRDSLVPSRYARTLHDAIVGAGGDSRFVLVEGAGHMLIDQQADEVAALLIEFIGRVHPDHSRFARA